MPVSNALPAPVRAVVEAINAGDTDAFLACFVLDGVVDDHGRRFIGRDAIRSWSDGEAIGANAQMTPNAVSVGGDTSSVVTVEAAWRSQVFNGDSSFAFELQDDLVKELRIPAS